MRGVRCIRGVRGVRGVRVAQSREPGEDPRRGEGSTASSAALLDLYGPDPSLNVGWQQRGVHRIDGHGGERSVREGRTFRGGAELRERGESEMLEHGNRGDRAECIESCELIARGLDQSDQRRAY